MKIRYFLLAIFLPYTIQAQETFEAIDPEHPDLDAVEAVEVEEEESTSKKGQRIRERYGDGAEAVLLLEDVSSMRKNLNRGEVRAELTKAQEQLETINTRSLSRKKKEQLAAAWKRLALTERALFGDTPEVINLLRIAQDLDFPQALVALFNLQEHPLHFEAPSSRSSLLICLP